MRDDFKRYEKECFMKRKKMNIKEFKESLKCDAEIEAAINELEKFINSLDFDNLPKNVKILDADSKPGKESVDLFIGDFESPLNTIMESVIDRWLKNHKDRCTENKAYAKCIQVSKTLAFGLDHASFDIRVRLDLSLL